MSRWCRILLLCIGANALVYSAVAAAPPRDSKQNSREGAAKKRAASKRERTTALLRQLQKPISSVAFDEEPFEEVIAWLKEQGVKNIIVSWKHLERTGLADQDTPITLVLNNTTLGEILDLVLDQLSFGASSDNEQFTYHIFDGLLRISTREDFARRVYTRTYYVEDLLYPFTLNQMMPYLAIGAQIPIAGVTDVVVAGGGGGGVIGGGGGGGVAGGGGGGGFIGGGGGAAAGGGAIQIIDQGIVFGPGEPADGRPDYEQIREDTLEDLIELIKSIHEDTWRDNGGKGTISAFSDKLVITQTIEMHEIIGGAFEQIASLQKKPRGR